MPDYGQALHHSWGKNLQHRHRRRNRHYKCSETHLLHFVQEMVEEEREKALLW